MDSQRLKAILFFIAGLFTCTCGDVTGKILSSDIHPSQVTFCRFIISLVVLLPFIGKLHPTRLMRTHILRGAILCLGTSCWVRGLQDVQVSTATVLNFSIPLFTLPIAYILLKERFHWTRQASAILGFAGVIVATQPEGTGFSLGAWIMVIGSTLYALLDVINKGCVEEESPLNMLFYSSLYGTLFSSFPAYQVWQAPSVPEWGLLVFFGLTANLVLYFMVKAYQLEEVTLLAPLHYVELVFTVIAGLIVFSEWPTLFTCIGALVIMISTTVATVYDRTDSLPETS